MPIDGTVRQIGRFFCTPYYFHVGEAVVDVLFLQVGNGIDLDLHRVDLSFWNTLGNPEGIKKWSKTVRMFLG